MNYADPDNADKRYTKDQLHTTDPNTQLAVMHKWFFDNYEDPAEGTPYSIEDGGYLFIRGGPYNARDVLNEEFGGVVDNDTIQALSHELTLISGEWAPSSATDERIEEWWDESASQSFRDFESDVRELQTLLQQGTHMDDGTRAVLFRLLYAHLITSMETYLADTFKALIFNSKAHLRMFVETTPAFKEEKLSVSQVFDVHSKIDSKIRQHLDNIMWHNLVIVKKMYKCTFDIDLPCNLPSLLRAVNIRHDMVHRSGKATDGSATHVDEALVSALGTEIAEFLGALDERVLAVSKRIGGNQLFASSINNKRIRFT